MTKKISVTMTLEQARACQDALDLYSRICIGQIEKVEDYVRMGVVPVGAKTGERQEASIEVCDAIKVLLDSVKVLLGYTVNGSNGIGNPHVHISAHRAYEVKKVIAKAIAEDRDPNPTLRGVDYDGLLVRYTTDPAPVAVIEQ